MILRDFIALMALDATIVVLVIIRSLRKRGENGEG